MSISLIALSKQLQARLNTNEALPQRGQAHWKDAKEDGLSLFRGFLTEAIPKSGSIKSPTLTELRAIKARRLNTSPLTYERQFQQARQYYRGLTNERQLFTGLNPLLSSKYILARGFGNCGEFNNVLWDYAFRKTAMPAAVSIQWTKPALTSFVDHGVIMTNLGNDFDIRDTSTLSGHEIVIDPLLRRVDRIDRALATWPKIFYWSPNTEWVPLNRPFTKSTHLTLPREVKLVEFEPRSGYVPRYR